MSQPFGFFLRFTLSVCAFFTVFASARAAIQFPGNLTQADRREALRIIGFGTSAKLLTDPFPLGGYAGFETGLSVENIRTSDLGNLGAGLPVPQQDVNVPKVTLGKGLYNNIDLFLHFTPYNRQDELSFFGGMLRWGFYQAKFLPISAAIVTHVNSANFGNQLVTQTYGADLICGIDVDNVSLFAGGGVLQSAGTFISGPNGITDSATPGTADESVDGFHGVIGTNVHVSNLFFTIQLDRYSQPVYSGKVGVRF